MMAAAKSANRRGWIFSMFPATRKLAAVNPISSAAVAHPVDISHVSNAVVNGGFFKLIQQAQHLLP